MLKREDLPLVVLGALTVGREKIQKLAKEMEKKGAVSKKEADKLAKELITKGNKERAELTSIVKDELEKMLNSLGIIRKKDLRALEQKIARLEKRRR